MKKLTLVGVFLLALLSGGAGLLLPRGAVLWAAIFDDGIWPWDGARWSQPRLNLPAAAREITALAGGKEGTIWLGTRRAGVWSGRGGAWKSHPSGDEPFAHNVQTLCQYRGALWASTLEDGLIARDARGWQHFGQGALSSNAPRQMAVFGDKLFVARHARAGLLFRRTS